MVRACKNTLQSAIAKNRLQKIKQNGAAFNDASPMILTLGGNELWLTMEKSQ